MEQARKSTYASRRIWFLSVESIRPNPAQPRQFFDEAGLLELSESIRRFGILQPLTVRRKLTHYELIAGERRLRAAKMAGLREVPCIIARAEEEESALLALIENLQRRDLHYFEEAEAIANLIAAYGFSQEQATEKLGRSQSAVANKLRLLRLGDATRELLCQNGLSERHARTLLRLADEEERLDALRVIISRGYTVAQSEEYVEELLKRKQTAPKKGRSYIIKDVRLFLNTVRRSVEMMKTAGVDAKLQRRDTEGEICLTVTIPRRNGKNC